jgi:thiamine biosynthesis lipoprotein
MNLLYYHVLLILLFVAGGCSRPEPVAKVEGFALGTVYSVSVKGSVPAGLDARIDSVFSVAEGSMSVFNKESLLSRLNRNETDSVDVHISYCIDMARGVSEFSGGRYDVTVLPLAEAYGFSGGKWDGLMDNSVSMDSLLAVVGYDKIEVRDGRLVKQHPLTRIDLNSIAKGYTVDLMARMLEREGVSDYLVNVGGEVFCRGTNAQGKPWVIGIETPVEGNFIQGASVERRLAVSGMGVATSGNYRNFHTDASGGKYTHIIDPVTGAGTESRLLSASVVAQTCALADALGTMFIALGLEGSLGFAESHKDIAVLLIFSDDEGRMMTFESEAMRAYIIK